MLFLFNFIEAHALNLQNNSFNSDKIKNLLNILLSNKEQLLKDSEFGKHEILFFNPVTQKGFVAETSGKSTFFIRKMSNSEITHSKRVLVEDSLYSQESFEKQRLVITICWDCVLKKLREFSTNPLVTELVSEEWLIALAFHEYTHAFDQKKWQHIYSRYPESCKDKIQEGSAFLLEAKAHSLFISGKTFNISDIRKYLNIFNLQEDNTFKEVYLLPALNLLDYESKTNDSFINGLLNGEIDPCGKNEIKTVK